MLRDLMADATRLHDSLAEAADEADRVEAAVRHAAQTGGRVSPGEMVNVFAELDRERAARISAEQQVALWQGRAEQAEAERDRAMQEPGAAEGGVAVPGPASRGVAVPGTSSAGPPEPPAPRHPVSPPRPPPQAAGKGGPPGGGSRKRPRQPSARLAGPVWSPAETRGAEVFPAGFKIHVGDLPAHWMDGNELEPWLEEHGVYPDAVSPMGLSPQFQRFQVILTFADEQACRAAKIALAGIDAEPPRHATTASWWQPR